MTKWLIILCTLFTTTELRKDNTFNNPLLESGADPWSIYHEGYYYYTNTLCNRLVLWKTKNLSQLKSAEKKMIWEPPKGTMYSHQLWAPELHFIDNVWYMYFAADDGKNENHRVYALSNTSADPMKGEWKFLGKISDTTDKWAIDATVASIRDTLYMFWSGWEGNADGQQNIYAARMKNPYTIDGSRVLISRPELSWETFGPVTRPDSIKNVAVNEGPQILQHGEKIILIYSASGCWTEKYSLGMLTACTSGGILKPGSWTKFSQPVFTASSSNKVFAPGHNSFFKSPDGTQDWILYHANDSPGEGCGKYRSPRAQPFTWSEDGLPQFGEPVSTSVELQEPSANNK